ncbi:MAG TPA: ABC transporter permease [Steroidobacteraceae bacterium]|nr:ABC transporter permease [Steroidobacteraceae bacterium]
MSITLHNVLCADRRPARAGTFAAVITLAWRAMLKIKHVPFQLFDVLVFPIMSTFMFTYLFGGALAGSTTAYLQWLVPGIVVQTMVFLTVYTGVSLNSDIQKGLFDRFKSLPIWQPAPVVGALLGDLTRYALAAAVVIIVGLMLGFRPGGGVPGVVAAIALMLLFVSAVSWMWIIVGMLVKTPESVMTTSMLLLFPLTFISNIFVDPRTMPGFMQTIVGINPVTHLTNAARGLMHGNVLVGDVLWVLAASLIVTAVFAPIAMRLYYRER